MVVVDIPHLYLWIYINIIYVYILYVSHICMYKNYKIYKYKLQVIVYKLCINFI